LNLGKNKLGKKKGITFGQAHWGGPLVSVIIPNKDCPYLKEAIDSVLAQTYKSIEMIIVLDNCSNQTKDDVIKMIGDWKHDFQVIVKDDKKPSIPSSRNAGLLKAQGDYIAFLSADDLWYPKFLEKTVGKGDIVYTDYDRIDSQGSWIGDTAEHHFERHEDFIIHLWQRCNVNLSACVIKNHVFGKTGMFDPEILMGEDYLFFLYAAKWFKFIHLPQHLAAYRIHGAQTTDPEKNAYWDGVLKKKAEAYWSE